METVVLATLGSYELMVYGLGNVNSTWSMSVWELGWQLAFSKDEKSSSLNQCMR